MKCTITFKCCAHIWICFLHRFVSGLKEGTGIYSLCPDLWSSKSEVMAPGRVLLHNLWWWEDPRIVTLQPRHTIFEHINHSEIRVWTKGNWAITFCWRNNILFLLKCHQQGDITEPGNYVSTCTYKTPEQIRKTNSTFSVWRKYSAHLIPFCVEYYQDVRLHTSIFWELQAT